MRQLGYYVHHHGAGHRERAISIAREAGGRIVLIGTGLAGRVGDLPHLDLPDDRLPGDAFDGADAAATRPAALHYAPVDHPGIRARVAALTGWIAAEAPALMVVDVSCEIAMLARLASVPTVVVRLGGVRDDAPHREAFRGATALLSPFAAALDDPAVPAAVAARTRYYAGLIARPSAATVNPSHILVTLGAGGPARDPAIWVRAARALPDREWTVIGRCPAPADPPPNLRFVDWVSDAPARIASAGVVVGGAGDGTIGIVLAACRPFVCIPEDRPFGEQRANAAGLARAGAAMVCDDPRHADWPALIAAAERLDPAAAAALDDPQGPRRAADWLLALADAA